MYLRVRRTLVAAALVLAPAGVPGPLSGQAASETGALRRTLLTLGDSARVRLMAPGVVVEGGLLLGLRSDSVLVADADARFTVGLDEIEALAVEGSLWRSVGLQSGAVALVAGAAAGFFLGYANCGNQFEGCDQHAWRVALRWGLVFGAGGAVAGATIGSRMRRWRQVFP